MSTFTWNLKTTGAREAAGLATILEKLDNILGVLTRSESRHAATQARNISAFKTTAKAASDVSTTVIKTANGFTKITNEVDKFGNVLRRTVTDVNNTADGVAKSTKVYDRLGTVIKSSSEVIEDTASKTKKLAAAQAKAARTVAKIHTETKKTAEGFQKITTTTNQFNQVIGKTIVETKQTAQGVSKTTKVLDSLGKTVKETSENVRDYTIQTKKGRGGTQGWGASLIKFLGQFNTVNKAFDFAAKRIRQFGAAATSVFNFVYRGSAAFEESAAALRAYGDETGEVSAKAADLARTSRFTSTQAAQAAIELKKAGQNNKDAMESMQPVLTASAANSISLSKAAKIASNSMAQFSQFGLGAKDALEILTGGAMSSTTNMQELSSAMKNAAPISSLLGQDITKVTTALSIMAQNGITAGRAGTAWKIAMERLSAPTPQATANLKKLGISLKDIDLSDPAAMMDIFRQAIAKIPKEADQIRMLKSVFGRSIGAILPMIKQGKAGFDEMTRAIEQNRGAMENLKAEKAKTMTQAFLMMQSASEGLSIKLKDFLGVPITGFFQAAADAINRVTDRLDEFSEGFGGAGMSVKDWFAAVQNGDFDGLFSGMKEEFSQEIDTIKTIILGLKELAAKWFREMWKSLTDENIIAEVAALGASIMDAIFSSENAAKAAKFGVEVGTQLLKGLSKTTEGKLMIGGMLAMGGVKAAGAAMTAHSAVKSVTGVLGGGEAAAEGAKGLGVFQTALKKASASLVSFGSGVARWLGMADALGGAGIGATATTGALAVGGAYVGGKLIQGGIEQWSQSDSRKQTVRGAEALSQGIRDLSVKRKEAGISPERKARIDKQIAALSGELDRMAASGSSGYFEASEKRGQELAKLEALGLSPEKALEMQALPDKEKAAKIKEIEAERARKANNESILMQAGIEDVANAINPKPLKRKEQEPTAPEGEKTLADLTDEELSGKKEILTVQQQIANAEIAQKAAMDEIATTQGKAQLEINKYAEALETWLVRPFDKFQEALNGIKEKFGGMMDNLKNKKIDLSEKFGLVDEKKAAKQRDDVVKKANERDEKLLEATEDPAKKAEIQKRMADRLAKQAETADGPEKTRLAKQAAGLLEGAEESTATAQEDELKKVEIRKKYAKENVAKYEEMLGKTESAGGKAAIQEALQQMYMDLGDREKAISNEQGLAETKMEAAIEKSEMQKQSLEMQKLQLEVAQRQLEQLTAMAGGGGNVLPEDPAYREMP